MRSKSSLFVDAGYLLASAATRLTGTSLRSGIHVEYHKLVAGLVEQAERVSGLPLLRVHWYDSARNAVPDPQQERIGELPRVKLRLGRFGVDGQQKGVDLRLGLDLVTHARNGAADTFILISGDDDLTEAVEEAQVHGVQVIILAVPNADGVAHGVSRHLVRAADELVTLTPETIDSSVSRVERPVPATVVRVAPVQPVEPVKPVLSGPTPKDIASAISRSAADTAVRPVSHSSTGASSARAWSSSSVSETDAQAISLVVRRVVQSLRQSMTATEWQEVALGRPSIPRDIDKALLLDASDALGSYDLSDTIRYAIRDEFWKKFDKPDETDKES